MALGWDGVVIVGFEVMLGICVKTGSLMGLSLGFASRQKD